MDKIDYINNFEYFKMANELATELYPDELEDKAEREMLIDYKAAWECLCPIKILLTFPALHSKILSGQA